MFFDPEERNPVIRHEWMGKMIRNGDIGEVVYLISILHTEVTPTHLVDATISGNKEMVELVLEYCPCAHHRYGGDTILDLTLEDSEDFDEEVVEILLEHGATYRKSSIENLSEEYLQKLHDIEGNVRSKKYIYD